MCECKIAKKLVELRNANGVTQEEVAKALSISNKTISKWENGTTTPDLSMLVKLSGYYNVSTDTLLGLGNDKKTTKEIIASEFNGLSRKDMVLKAFEIVKAIFPASYNAAGSGEDDIGNEIDVVPQKTDFEMNRYQISLNEFFNFAVCSDEVNIAVMQLRNKANFTWLNDSAKLKEIVKLLTFLADSDALKICAFIHTTTCFENFTADYMAKNTGVTYEKTVEILERSCTIGLCKKVVAHLKDGDVTVYESFGNGIILALISLAYEQMCGSKGYNYHYEGGAKMIGGKRV